MTTRRGVTIFGTISRLTSRTMLPGYRIQQRLEDEEVARVGLICRFALDCLCTEMYEFCHGP